MPVRAMVPHDDQIGPQFARSCGIAFRASPRGQVEAGSQCPIGRVADPAAQRLAQGVQGFFMKALFISTYGKGLRPERRLSTSGCLPQRPPRRGPDAEPRLRTGPDRRPDPGFRG